MDLLHLVAPADDIVYIGRRTSRGEAVVTMESVDGTELGQLPNAPTGRDRWPGSVEWGYGGQGPRELSRSLLLHALGSAAVCHTCGGTGGMRVRAVPATPDGYVLESYADGPVPDADHRVDCPRYDGCEWGNVAVPGAQFFDDYVARWPKGGTGEQWRLRRSEVLAWLRGRAVVA
ncbi:DUF6166 domain-containing protein [Streptomyces sp. NPDC091272]|uniref:DUF6166 domain-containing protein n=1 Tax=Streptomyces sp. NPDC091272 TaxID=3365981 RepID=UPI0038265338